MYWFKQMLLFFFILFFNELIKGRVGIFGEASIRVYARDVNVGQSCQVFHYKTRPNTPQN